MLCSNLHIAFLSVSFCSFFWWLYVHTYFLSYLINANLNILSISTFPPPFLLEKRQMLYYQTSLLVCCFSACSSNLVGALVCVCNAVISSFDGRMRFKRWSPFTSIPLVLKVLLDQVWFMIPDQKKVNVSRGILLARPDSCRSFPHLQSQNTGLPIFVLDATSLERCLCFLVMKLRALARESSVPVQVALSELNF